MKTLLRSFLASLLCVAAMPAAAIKTPVTSWQIDPAQTKVEFTLGDILHTVHGSFALKRGSIRLDKSGKAAGELVVDASSGNSGSEARDRRMKANILESTRYPEIAFRPDRVDGKVAPEGNSQVQVHGMFLIHGEEHELTLPFEVQASGGQYTAETRFIVPYVKWGMKNPSTLILRVSDKVEIAIHAILTPGMSSKTLTFCARSLPPWVLETVACLQPSQ